MSHYYLSEMAVSDKHGGGLTLQRVLGDDLLAFDRFVHLSEFAEQVAPIVDSLADREVALSKLYKIWTSRFRRRLNRIMERLNVLAFSRWSEDRFVRGTAAHILNNFTPANCSWLVVPQSSLAVRVMNEVQRRRAVRYLTWMMDDHVVRWKNGWYYPKWYKTEFGFHLRRAEKVFVISSEMAQFYRDRFGVDSEVLHCPTDVKASPVIRSPMPTGPARLVYFGTVGAWQRDALDLLVSRLDDIDATLDLHVFHKPPAQLLSPRVFPRPPVHAGEVIARMREFDGVVIPAGFREEQRHLTELNISTKLSECYASGTVPVIIAPAYAAMAKFARKHGGALVISDFNDRAQMHALRNIKMTGSRARILEEARQAVDTQCSSSIMRRRWVEAWKGETSEASLSQIYC